MAVWIQAVIRNIGVLFIRNMFMEIIFVQVG